MKWVGKLDNKTGHELIIFEAGDRCMWVHYTILYFTVCLKFSLIKLFFKRGCIRNIFFSS